MKSETETSAATGIPHSGKTARLLKNIRRETTPDVFQEMVTRAGEAAEQAGDDATRAWVRELVNQMETCVGRETGVRIMERCGRECFAQHSLAQHLETEPQSLAEVLAALNRGSVRIGRDGDATVVEYLQCLCHLVKRAPAAFSSETYCYCSAGWWKALIETVTGQPADVELAGTILAGAEHCRFVIHPYAA